jgi:hypothetical protein
MKTPEELAEEWIETSGWNEEPFRDEYVIEFKKEGYVAGYKAAQEHAHAALEEAEARIQELQDQLADADKVINSSNNSNGWISVKERLPEIEEVRNDYKRSKCVLWIDCDKDIMVGYHLTIGDRTRVMTRFSEPRISNFTHWMPLPEPPKEEE